MNMFTSVTDAAKALYTQKQHCMMICNGVKYVKLNNCWSIAGKNDFDIVNEYLKKLSRGNPRPFTISESHKIHSLAWENVIDNPTFYDTLWRSSGGWLCFNNGVLNIATKEFHTWDQHPEICSPTIIQYDYTPNYRNEELISYIKQRVFELPLGTQCETFLNYIAHRIAGDTNNDKWIVFYGTHGCGKRTIITLIESTFEKYCSRIVSKYFQAEDVGWMSSYQFSRLAISIEPKLCHMNDELLKLFRSDEEHRLKDIMINTGLLFTSTTAYTPHTDMIEVTSQCKFYNPNTITKPKPSWIKQDETVLQNCSSNEWKQAMIQLILDFY